MGRLDSCRLYGILDLGYVEPGRAVPMTEQMVTGGVDILQLRAKESSEAEIETLAREILPLCRSAGVPFILNDFPEIAARTGTDGVHVGQDDLTIEEARLIVGADAIVGKSTHSLAQARAAALEPVDYIGFGPLFSTPTKPEYVPIGLDDIRQIHQDLTLPIFCIGGIKRENALQVLQAGAKRLVIVSGILQAPGIPAYIRDVRKMLNDQS